MVGANIATCKWRPLVLTDESLVTDTKESYEPDWVCRHPDGTGVDTPDDVGFWTGKGDYCNGCSGYEGGGTINVRIPLSGGDKSG